MDNEREQFAQIQYCQMKQNDQPVYLIPSRTFENRDPSLGMKSPLDLQ